MNTQEKNIFVLQLVNTVVEDIMKQVPKMPDSWDGIELRAYINEKFEDATWTGGHMTPTRLKNYKNDIITLNL
jgi:hypothetical protein